MNSNPQSPETNSSSLEADVTKQLSLDVLFDNLNKSLQNKFNSNSNPSANEKLNLNNNKKDINFFRLGTNNESPNLKLLQNSSQDFTQVSLKIPINNNMTTNCFNKCEYMNHNNNNSELFGPSKNQTFCFNNAFANNCKNENNSCSDFSHSDSQGQKIFINSQLDSNSTQSPNKYNNFPPLNLFNHVKSIQSSNQTLEVSQNKLSSESPSNQESNSNTQFQSYLSAKTPITFMDFMNITPDAFSFNSSNFNQFPPSNQNEHFITHHQLSGNYNYLNSPISITSNNVFSKIKLQPSKLNFLPTEDWSTEKNEVSLESLVTNFFRARCSSKILFEHKLWNALQITLYIPHLFSHIGVKWASKTIIQINQEIFGNFLDLKKVTSALFTSKGFFPLHGFDEVSEARIKDELNKELSSSEMAECRFLEHRQKLFRKDSIEKEIASIQCEKL